MVDINWASAKIVFYSAIKTAWLGLGGAGCICREKLDYYFTKDVRKGARGQNEGNKNDDKRYGYDKRTASQKVDCGFAAACVVGDIAAFVQCGGLDCHRTLFGDGHAVACGGFVQRCAHQSCHQRGHRLVHRHKRCHESGDRQKGRGSRAKDGAYVVAHCRDKRCGSGDCGRVLCKVFPCVDEDRSRDSRQSHRVFVHIFHRHTGKRAVQFRRVNTPRKRRYEASARLFVHCRSGQRRAQSHIRHSSKA